MESRRRRSRSQILKWVCYGLLLFVCAALQTTPGLFQIGAAKPLYLLPLCLAVSVYEGEFAGALFGAVCGLMWDYTAGRTVGMLALELMLLCFAIAVLVQLYLQSAPGAQQRPCWCSPATGCSSTTCRAMRTPRRGICGSCCRRRCSPSRYRWCCFCWCGASTMNFGSTTAWCNCPPEGTNG